MISRILLATLLVVAACSTTRDVDGTAASAGAQDASSSIDPQNPLAYDDADCNLSTALQPGVPGSPGHLILSPRNPNGDSELAVLMRRFVDDLQAARIEARAGGALKPLFPTHRRMRCAWPTNPKERNQDYDLRAQAYLFAVRQFDAMPGEATYNAIVANCVACHQASCNSVIPFIETLKW